MISILQLGVAASVDEDGSVYLGKGTDDGTNHYLIIEGDHSGYSYAYANQDKNTGEVLSYKTIQEAVTAFQNNTQKQ